LDVPPIDVVLDYHVYLKFLGKDMHVYLKFLGKDMHVYLKFGGHPESN